MHGSRSFATWTRHVLGVADRLVAGGRSDSPEVMGRLMAAGLVRFPLNNPGSVRHLALLLARHRTPTHDHRSTDLVRRLTEWGLSLSVHLAIADLASGAVVSRSGRGPQ